MRWVCKKHGEGCRSYVQGIVAGKVRYHPFCPACGKKMKKVRGYKGASGGEYKYACKCKGTENLILSVG